MPGATMTTVNSILKEIYQGRIREQLQDEIIGLKRIEGTSAGVETTVGGKYVTFPIRVRRNQGIGYRSEDTALPAAGQQGYASVRVGLKYGYGRIRITGQVMKLAKTNPQAFANAMDQEMTGLKDDIRKDSARIFYGDGSGKVVTATGAGSTTTLVSTNLQYVQMGMVVDAYTAANAPNGTNLTVTGIDKATGTVTFSPAAGAATAAGGYLVRAGDYNLEPMGLAGIVASSGQLQNLDPATEPEWKSVVNPLNGTISEAAMIKMVDDIRVNGGKTSLILCSLGVRRAYFNLLIQNRRFVDNKTYEGGYIGLPFNSGREIPVVEDVDAPPGIQWFLDESAFKVYREEPWSWIDADGDIFKWVVNYDAWEAVLAQYWELGVDRRNAQGKITGITEA